MCNRWLSTYVVVLSGVLSAGCALWDPLAASASAQASCPSMLEPMAVGISVPTFRSENTVTHRQIITQIWVALYQLRWAKDATKPDRGTYFSYELDDSPVLYFSLPGGGDTLIIKTDELSPGTHRIVLALKAGTRLTQRQTYCLRVPQ